jgi:anti-sigma factor RsiW
MNKIDEQLNLWANGRLPEAERQAFEKKMAEDPALAREAEFLQALRQTVRNEPVTPPGELGLARLQKAMRDEREEKRSETPEVSPHKNYWKPVAIAACLMVAVQAALLLGPTPWKGSTAVDVGPASGEGVAAGPQLQIVFAPEATTADIQAAVLSVNGSIVAGPSALGVFRLGLPEDASTEAAVETLQAFEFVDEVIAP